MSNGRSNLVDIPGEVVVEQCTEKAFRFYATDSGRVVWLPASLCEWDESDETMAMPYWLARDKELI